MKDAPRLASIAAALAALLLGACDPAEPPPQDDQDHAEQFTATLSAAAVVGQNVTSGATGAAAFSWDGATLVYAIDVQAISQVFMAHIHGPASTVQNANIILTLFAPDGPTGTVNGRLVSGSVQPGSGLLEPGFTLDAVLGLMRDGQAYVLVHTTPYPDGEIRGQLTVVD